MEKTASELSVTTYLKYLSLSFIVVIPCVEFLKGKIQNKYANCFCSRESDYSNTTQHMFKTLVIHSDVH